MANYSTIALEQLAGGLSRKTTVHVSKPVIIFLLSTPDSSATQVVMVASIEFFKFFNFLVVHSKLVLRGIAMKI